MQRKTKRIWLVFGIFFGAVGLAAGLMSMRPEPPKKDVEKLDLLVDVIELQPGKEQFRISSQGVVRPRTQTTLSAEVSGAIVSISPKFIAGGVFSANEVLMRIDPSNYEVAVHRAEALLKQRQIEFDGAEKLRLQGYRAEAELAAAAAALAAARAELVNAQRNFERTYIRLPYDGMVLSKDADLGQYVNPGTPIGVTFATDYAEIRLPLTDQDLAFVEVPPTREITATGSADGPHVKLSAIQLGRQASWDAQIVRSEGVVDERSRVTYVVAHVDDPYRLHSDGVPLPIGTFVSASIEGSGARDVMRVPRTAVRGSNQLLFVTDDHKIEIRSVNILRSDNEFVYVDSGAMPGERITTTAIAAPTNGMSVRVASELASDGDAEGKPDSQVSLGAGN